MFDGLIPFHTMDGAAFLATGAEPKREGERLNGGSAYDFYETLDGRYLSVGCLEPPFWRRFCELIGRPDLTSGGVFPENVGTVKEELRAILKGKTMEEWLAIFQGEDVCVEPVLSLEEALTQDEHLSARQMVVDVPLPLGEEACVRQLGCSIKLSDCPAQYRHGGYPMGYHTNEVLAGLGYTTEQIDLLNEKGSLTKKKPLVPRGQRLFVYSGGWILGAMLGCCAYTVAYSVDH